MSRVGTPLGAGEARSDITVAEALARLQAWHAAVSKAGAGILSSYRAKGQGVPCDVRGRHNTAVSAYLRAARDVFVQLAKRGIPVTQVVVDAAGAERMLGPTKENPLPAPVPPLTFVVSDCQGADRGMGAIPLIFPVVASLTGAAVILLLSVARGVPDVTQALGQRLTWPGGPPPPFDQVADAYLRCLRQTKDARACSGLLPPKRADWVSIGVVAALVIVVAVGGIIAYRRLGRAPAQLEPAEEAA